MGERCTCGGRPSPIYPTQLCICEAFAVRRGMDAIAAGVVGSVFHAAILQRPAAPVGCIVPGNPQQTNEGHLDP